MTDKDAATWRDGFGVFSDTNSKFAEYSLNDEGELNLENIFNHLSTFLNERDIDAPLSPIKELCDNYHARRHRCSNTSPQTNKQVKLCNTGIPLYQGNSSLSRGSSCMTKRGECRPSHHTNADIASKDDFWTTEPGSSSGWTDAERIDEYLSEVVTKPCISIRGSEIPL
jgi:hypothetical protein